MMKLFVVASLLLLQLHQTTTKHDHKTKSNGLMIKMIHRDSRKSPFYDPKLTLEDRVRRMNMRSEARISQLLIDNNLEKYVDAFQIIPFEGYEFLVPLKIGTPPVPQILVMDTGSLLLWVHCGYTMGGERSPYPLYVYSHSSSYIEDVFCKTPMCELIMLKGECGRDSKRCEYTYRYMSGMTQGNLASEVFTFQSPNGTDVTMNKCLMFGCSSILSKGANHVSGILGLSKRAISLISQLNHTGFSYCIGNINDEDYDSNTLVLGGEPVILENSTPMFIVIGKYYITLEKISVGDKFLDIDSSIFKRINYEGGMLVDSGTTSTYLPHIAFNKLKEEIRFVIGTTLTEHISSRQGELCYRGTISEDLKNFPTIAFHFVENAVLKFDAQNLFRQDKTDYFCLSVQSMDSDRLSQKLPFSILGIWAQQFNYIAFDINIMRMPFTKIDCDILYD